MFESLNLGSEQKDRLLRVQFEAQNQAYLAQYPEANFDLVLVNEIPAGKMFAQRGPNNFVLIDIALLPEHRNVGIATELVGDLIEEASTAGQALHAHVQKDNPAQYLWQRLGFRQVSDDGVYLKLEIPPGNSLENK